MPISILDPISAAVDRALELLKPVASEFVTIGEAMGRVLAGPLCADRSSPPINVSAMDGYAVRIQDCERHSASGQPLRVSCVARAGNSVLPLPSGEAVQIFTGAPVPPEADCVIRREDTLESHGQMQLNIPVASLKFGQNIRYSGENIRAGAEVLSTGTAIGSASVAALATFGSKCVEVHRQIRVSILTSGDELVSPGEPVQPWQIRDSNSSTLQSWLARLPWARVQNSSRISDSLESTQKALSTAVHASDAVILTGGVSAGDTDYVLPAIESLGGQVVFHRLPIRPGKPVLVAVLGQTLVVGLPGNPVSAAVTSRVIAEPLLGRLAGLRQSPGNLRLTLSNADDKTLNLFWYRLIRLSEFGTQLVDTQGSGDLVSLAQSDGFLEMPPGCSGSGPWRTWLW